MAERGRPAAGYFTKRTAEAWMRDLLDDARRHASTAADEQPITATFADAAAEWLRFIEQDRQRKPSTVGGYASIVRTQLLPTFASMPLESITPDTIDAWLARTAGSVSSRRKSLVLLHGIFRRARKVWGLRVNRSPMWRSRRSRAAATSTSSHRRRCGRSAARPAQSSTPPCT